MTRSMLFVPGDADRKIERGLASGADALILDLEDSVAPDRKAAARERVRQALQQASPGHRIWVRVNSLQSGLVLDDLTAVVPARPFGVVLPKCEGRIGLQQLAHYLDAFEAAAKLEAGSTRILVIATETARSLFALGEYSGVSARLWGLTWGGEDLSADVGSLGNRSGDRYTEPYRLARSLCLFAAAAAGVRAIDAVCTDLRNEPLLRSEASEGFRDGFSGKLAIHPAQVEPINKGFSPDPATLEWARKVVDLFQAQPGSAAFSLDGKMVDVPHLRLAERLLGKA